jgi:hypothetical protein
MVFDGQQFYDKATQQEMMIKTVGDVPWLYYKHPNGQWVTLRKATAEDIRRIEDACPRIEAQ